MPAPHVGRWAEKYAPVEDISDNDLWHGDIGPDRTSKSRSGYYGSVSFVDEKIGMILAALEKRGLLDNTLILFAGDHGDMLGDHNLWRKSYPYEGSTHIPMIMRWPANMGMENSRGKAISRPVEHRDVLPTFLDTAGAAIPDGLDGRSLLKLVRGETADWREYIDLEHNVCYSEVNHWNALTDGRWKYIFHAFDGSQQLFDLETDPYELNDLTQDPSYNDILEAWRRRMVDHLSERGEGFVSNCDLIPRPNGMLYSPNYPAG